MYVCIYIYISIWWFPKIGLPPVLIHNISFSGYQVYQVIY